MTDLKINTYPKHIGDWRSGTARMSLAEEGAYTRLADQYYLDQGKGWTPDECLRICRAVTRDEQKAVKSVLSAKFEKTETGFRHSGMDKRIVDIEEASAKNKARAEAAARARWAKQNGDKPFPDDAQSNPPSIEQALLEDCHPKTKSQKPVKDGSRISKEILSPSGESEREGFSDFVKAYPQPDGVNAARDKWVAIVTSGTSPKSILDGLASAKTAWREKHGSDVTWIPKAKTWLEHDGWLDHVGVTHTPERLPQWSGPQDIRDNAVAEAGEDFVKSYLDPCDFDGGSKTIIAGTGYAADKLKRLLCLRNYQISKRS